VLPGPWGCHHDQYSLNHKPPFADYEYVSLLQGVSLAGPGEAPVLDNDFETQGNLKPAHLKEQQIPSPDRAQAHGSRLESVRVTESKACLLPKAV
jgi:hypothetical protein